MVGIPYPLTAAERVQPISGSALDGWESSRRESITIALPQSIWSHLPSV
jgi:hypothetical protein